MEEKKKTSKKSMLWIGLIIVGIIIIISLFSNSPNTTSTTTTQIDDFNQKAMQRFADIKSSIPELNSISCDGGDCSAISIVYFDFNKVPKDLDFIMRGNTVTFSNFRLKEKGVSHVSLIARYNGKIIYTCDGSKGVVDSCK